MKTKINKFIKAIVLIFLLLTLVTNPVYATSQRPPESSGGKTAADDLFSNITAQDESWSSMRANSIFGGNAVDSSLNVVLGVGQVLWWIGIAISVALMLRLGFKYATNPIEKSEAKESTLPTLITVIVLVGAYPIWRFVIVLFNS